MYIWYWHDGLFVGFYLSWGRCRSVAKPPACAATTLPYEEGALSTRCPPLCRVVQTASTASARGAAPVVDPHRSARSAMPQSSADCCFRSGSAAVRLKAGVERRCAVSLD